MSDQIQEIINRGEPKPQITSSSVELPPIRIDFSKQPDAVLAAPIESPVILPNESAEVSVNTETVSVNGYADRELKQKNNPIQRLKNWFQNPASTDKIKILNLVTAPAELVTAVGFTGLGISGTVLMSDIVVNNPLLIGPTAATFFGSIAVSMGGMITRGVSANIVDRIVRNEMKNRITFGKLLNVSKANLTRFSLIYGAFKDKMVSANSQIGELHFGTQDKEYWTNNSKSLAIKDILAGLDGLAESCLNGDPRIEGLETFATASTLLYPQYFEQFGFEIKNATEVKGGSGKLMSFINNAMSVFKGTPKETYPGEYDEKEMYIGMITRESLVQNKPLISEKLKALNRRI